MYTSILKRVFICSVLAVTLITPVMANQPAPHVKITFGKPAEVMLGATAPILITIDALVKLDSVSVTITLPDGVELRSGNLDHRMSALLKGGQVVLPVDIAIVDSIISDITVSVESWAENKHDVLSRTLTIICYDGIAEILDIFEVTDQTTRFWLAEPLSESAVVEPIDYLDTFIQAEPGDRPYNPAGGVYEAGKPFITRNEMSALENGITPAFASVPPDEGEDPPPVEPQTVTGRITYRGNPTTRSMANATIRIEKKINSTWIVLGSTTTNATGNFSRGVNNLAPGDVFRVSIRLENSNIIVRSNTLNDLYIFYTPNFTAGSGGTNIGAYHIGTGSYQACYIFNSMNKAWAFSVANGYTPSEDVITEWPLNVPLMANHWFFLTKHINIKESYWATSRTHWHEFGHAVMHFALGYWPLPAIYSHTFGENASNSILAWTEGWADAFSAFVRGNGMYGDEDLETLNPEYDTGDHSEATVAAIFWDLYDSETDPGEDDYITLPYSKLIAAIEADEGYSPQDIHAYWGLLGGVMSYTEKYYAYRTFTDNKIIHYPIMAPITLHLAGEHIFDEGDYGTWTASTTGLSGSASYTWYFKPMGASSWGNPVSYSNQYSAQINDDMKVKVDVHFSIPSTSTYYDASSSLYLFCRGGGPPPPGKVMVPEEYALDGNYPNPFNPETHISYALPKSSRVSLVIYDITGKEVRSWNMTENAGFKNMIWNGTNNTGQPVPGGVYIYKIQSVAINGGEQFTESRKMILLK